MSLYHETAQILSDTSRGGSLKNRVFGKKGLKSPPGQVYALAVESCRWSEVLKEVIEGSGLLSERKVRSPVPHTPYSVSHDLVYILRSYSLLVWTERFHVYPCCAEHLDRSGQDVLTPPS